MQGDGQRQGNRVTTISHEIEIHANILIIVRMLA